MGEVDLQWSHRNVSRFDRVKVGPFARVGRRPRGADPVAGLAARSLGLDHRLRLVPPSEARDAIALELALRDIGYVDVEQPFAERLVPMPPQQLEDYGRGGLEVAADLVRKRHGERRYAQKITFGGASDGT